MEKKERLRPVHRSVEARALRIHPQAQRELVPSQQRRFRDSLDLDAIGVLYAVEAVIDGVFGLWVIDGQHRLDALIAHEMGDWMVDVMVFTGDVDVRRACDLFLRYNDRASVATFEKFDKAVKAGRPVATRAVEVLAAHGLAPAKTHGDGKVACVSSLVRCAGIDDGKSLDLALDTVKKAWGKNATAYEGKILEALTRIYAKYNGEIDRKGLVKKLAKYPGGPGGLLGNAKGRARQENKTVNRSVLDLVTFEYNKGRRGGRLGEQESA